MLRTRFALLTISAVLALIMVGCGGGAPLNLGPDSAGVTQEVPPLPRGALQVGADITAPVSPEWFTGANLADDPLAGFGGNGTGKNLAPGTPAGYIDVGSLGDLPPFDAPADSPVRGASELLEVDLSGPAAETGNVVADVESLDIPSAAGETEWARYAMSVPEDEDLITVAITGTLENAAHGEDSGLWVAVSNYSLDHWQFFGPYSLTSQVLLNLPKANYTNLSGEAHLVLLTSDGDSVNISQLIYNVEASGMGAVLPQEFITALTAAGLGLANLSMDEVDTFGPGLAYNTWGWYLYLYDSTNAFEDLRTLLPSYWSGWYGSSDAGFFQPEQYPEYVKDKGDTLDQANELLDVLMAAIDEFPSDKQVTRQDFTPALASSDKLAQAIADYVDASGGTSDFATYQAALAAMPDEQQAPLARVVLAARDASVARDDVFYNPTKLGFPDEATVQTWFESAQGVWISRSDYIPALIDTSGGSYFMRGWPYNTAYFEGAVKLASAIDQLTTYINDNDPAWENVSLDVDTDWGRITIGGTGDDTYTNPDANGYAVLIDTGGMDTYDCTAGATASGMNGVAVAIDLGNGNDTHVAQDDPLDGNRGNSNDDNTSQQGAGRMGIGVFVDYGGQDEYNAVRMSQGFGMMGVGILADYGVEDDTYNLEGFGQGGAIGGIGILLDDGGSTQDTFNIWGEGQGYGGVMGVGMLTHFGDSDDVYYAEPAYSSDRPEYNSAQMADVANANFVQGAALGMRWQGQPPNPNSGKEYVAAGGYGLLYDRGGNDSYNCGIFGQAIGFFHGQGLLIDQGGDDTHHGIWYTQGATAHCGLACLWDGGGDDSYDNEQSIGIGGAHDWSVTWFLERSGNDTYDASSLAVGTGYNNAFGYFIDSAGWDEYHPTYADGTVNTLGRGGWPATGRETQPSYGIFVDVLGHDTYDPAYAGMLSGVDSTTVIDTPPVDNAQWVRVNGNPDAGNGFYALGYGSGYDAR